jgi:hypothetical protein
VVTGNGGDPGRTSTGRGFGHTRYDTIDKIELQYLRLASANYSRLLLRMANCEDWPVEGKTQEEIDALIEAMRPGGGEDTATMLRDYVAGWDELHPDTKEWLDRQS